MSEKKMDEVSGKNSEFFYLMIDIFAVVNIKKH